MTDESGNVDECYDYLPFGRMLTSNDNGRSAIGCYPSSPTGYTSDLAEKFTGQQRDEILLDYFIARYFSGGQGRFTGADLPFMDQWESDPQSWNLYVYVRNNPFSFVDPTGREIACVIVTSDSAAFGGCEGRFDEFLLSSFLSDLPCGIDVVIDGLYAYTTCGDYTPGFVEQAGLETTPLDIGFLDLLLPASFGKAVGFFGFADDLFRGARAAAHSLDDLSRAAGALRADGTTAAVRALQSHSMRGSTAFPRVTGNLTARNAMAQGIVDDILTNPGSISRTRLTGRFGEVLELVAPDGRGVRFRADGSFVGFLEPPR